MATAGFELDTKSMERLLRTTRARLPKVAARVVNKSAKSTKVAMVKAVRTDLGLKAGVVRDAIKMTNARPGRNPTAKLGTSPERIPLIDFGAIQLKRAGVRARLKGGAKTYRGAFIATLPGGHRGVLKRSTYPGGARLPIRELHGPSLAKVFVKKWRVGVKRFREQIRKNIVSELRFASRGR